jgi:amino acid adenylation domain-containing protein/non-ribosomal peptide synthase protein (TIGR01720 family)
MTGITRKRFALSERQQALFEELLRQQGVASAPAEQITPRSGSGELPLAFSQQRLWFLEQLQPGNPAYAIARAFCIHGQVSLPALGQSLQELVRRHEVLRTTFVTVEGRAAQVIHPTLHLALPVIDLRQVEAGARADLVHQLLVQQACQPFDLARGPLLRALLLRTQAQEAVLLLQMHHIVSDAWSLGIVYRELSQLYTALRQGQPSPLPALPIQYADYALWQHERLQGQRLQGELAYWKDQLAGAPTVLELPTDRPRKQTPGVTGGLQTRWLSARQLRQLKALGQREECTLYMVLLTAFSLLLSRYSGQEEVVVGSPIAGRTQAETEALIGFFVNTLALRADLRGNPSLRQALARVRQATLGAYAHQELPFEKLVDALQLARTTSHNPLFQALLTLQNVSAPDLAFADLRLTPLELGLETTRFDLALYAQESDQGLELTAVYSTDLFDAPTISRLLEHLCVLLDGMVADPQQRIREMPLLTPQEYERCLLTWQSNESLPAQQDCLHTLFAAQVARCPDAVAVVCEEHCLTYRALDLLANRLAHALRRQGVGPEVAVGLYMERSLLMICALLAVLKAGGAYVPLDPDTPAERLAFLVEDAGLPLLLTTEQQEQACAALRVPIVCLDRAWATLARDASLPQSPPPDTAQAGNLAYIIYTSGSTGRPKGVAVEHRQIVHYLHGITARLQVRPQASFALVSTMAADLGHSVLFPALCGGGCLHIITRERAKAPEELADYFRRQAIDCLKIVPSHLAALLSGAHPQDVLPRQQLVLGGEAAPPAWFASLQSLNPACRILNHYGPTETTVGALTCQLEAGEHMGASVPLGRPLPGVCAYVLDAYLQPLPVGVPGELFIAGQGVTRGYLGRPELTAERFLPAPTGCPGARLYRSGDRARYLPDGRIEFLGRGDQQIKIRGFRIEPGEIASVLEQHPQVRQAVVVAREQASGSQALVAYLTWRQAAGEIAELRAYLQERLPAALVPTGIVALERLPLTPNGKIDRNALPAAGPSQTASRPPAHQACSEVEQRLAAVWAQVLHLPQVGIHENFFELGGDSILSILIIARARKAGLQITPRQMFQCQTIAELAAAIAGGSVSRAEQGMVTGRVPLTPIQHWLFAQQLPAVHHRNQSMVLEMRERPDPAHLARACGHLLRHHDALRLRFRENEHGWEQSEASVEESGESPLCVIDLAAVPAHAQLAALEQIAATAQTSLDLAHGPLLRMVLFQLAPHRPDRLLLLIHHLAVDGVSWRILLEDLQTLYSQLQQGRAVSLPAKTTSLQSWATRLMAYARTQAAEEELACWRSLCARDRAGVPLDEVRGENTVASEQVVTLALERQATRSLLQQLPVCYHAQINDLLLAALAITCARWTSGTSLLVALEGHGREDLFADVDLSRTVGWFTSLVPVVLPLGDPSRPAEVVDAVRQELLRPPHHGIGYGILRYLGAPQIQEQVSALGQAQVNFNYLGQFDQSFEADSLFGLPEESVSPGPDACPAGRRAYVLEITASVSGGQLAVNWIYSEHLHRRATIERLARTYLDVLQELIAHALAGDAREQSAADFALAGLDDTAFATLATLLDATGGQEVLG